MITKPERITLRSIASTIKPTVWVGKDGFDFAYRYPGMNKVLQAAGRVIRTAEDVGVIALLDDRFLQSQSTVLFPREWEDRQVTDRLQLGQQLAAFWKNVGHQAMGHETPTSEAGSNGKKEGEEV